MSQGVTTSFSPHAPIPRESVFPDPRRRPREPQEGGECNRDVPEARPFPKRRGPLGQETHHPTSTCHLGGEEGPARVVAAPSPAAGPGLRGLPEGRAEDLDQARGAQDHGALRARSRAPASFGFARVGESVPGSGRAGRQLPGPSPTSPPPGFLRRLRRPCCCGAEAAPRSRSGRDRLRNRFTVGGLATNPAAAAAAEQGLPASARARAAGAEGRVVAR